MLSDADAFQQVSPNSGPKRVGTKPVRFWTCPHTCGSTDLGCSRPFTVQSNKNRHTRNAKCHPRCSTTCPGYPLLRAVTGQRGSDTASPIQVDDEIERSEPTSIPKNVTSFHRPPKVSLTGHDLSHPNGTTEIDANHVFHLLYVPDGTRCLP